MKNYAKIISLVLAVIFVLSMLAACKPADSGDGGAGGSKTLITLSADYVVVRPELCSGDVVKAAVSLTSALSTATGADITIKEDFLYGDEVPAQYEILVGQTNREESAAAIADIKYQDYTVTVSGSKLVINAYTDEKLLEAIEYVKSLVSGGTLAITDSHVKTVRAEYKFDQLKFGDVALNGYTIVIPKKANGIIKSFAGKLQGAILDASGVYLPIENDDKAEVEKEILLGNTNREASKAVKQAVLPANGYSITASGSKIVIKGKDDNFTFVKTINNIIAELDSGAFNASEGKITLNNDPIFTAFTFTDVHNNFAMLEPTNSTGNYIVRKNVDGMIDHMIATEGKVDLVMVGGDLMSDYPSWNSSGNWPYQYFVEYRQLLIDTFGRLAKDGKCVTFNGGNHDYGQGENATAATNVKEGYTAIAPHTPTGNYNSSDFYFGEAGMRQNIGELPEEDMFWKVGEHTGDKYLLAYYYKMGNIHVMGLAPDPDHPGVWSKQGDGFSDECLEWLDKKLDEIDPYGTEIIFMNCHYPLDCVYEDKNDSNKIRFSHSGYNATKLIPIYKGHQNLFHFFGHWESYYHDYSVKGVIHHTMAGTPIQMTGYETSSTEVIGDIVRGFNSVNMGHFRPMYNDNPQYFYQDSIRGYGGYNKLAIQHGSTRTPRVAQGMYVKVYEDRIVFQVKNYGDYPGYKTSDILEPYTVWLYK